MNLRDVLLGMAFLKWWQWTTSRDRPRDAVQEQMRRKDIKAWLCYRMRMDEGAAAWVARNVPRAWL